MMRVAGQEGGDPHRWDAEPHMIRGATPDIASNAFMRWMLAGDTDDAAPAQRGPSTAAGKKAMCDMARPRRSSRRHYPGKWQRPTTPLVPGTVRSGALSLHALVGWLVGLLVGVLCGLSSATW